MGSSTQKKFEAIKGSFAAVPYFEALSEEELTLLALASCIITKKAGEFILRAGDETTHYYYLQKGTVAHCYLKPNGKHFIVQAHTEGSLFFVSLALAQTRFSGYLETVEESRVICIPSVETLRLVKSNSKFAQSLLHYAINDNLHLNDTVINFLADARSRFCRFLLRRALESGEQDKGGIRIDLGMSKSGIASALDLSPETLSRTIALMKEEGVIEMENSTVTIRSVKGLVKMSENL